jgi:hypothetical protein
MGFRDSAGFHRLRTRETYVMQKLIKALHAIRAHLLADATTAT